jgi:acyl dehydratase
MTSEQPLVGADALRTIGTVVSDLSGTVVRRDFQRWAAAVGDHNPLYFDDAFAREHGYREAVAPPLFPQYATLGVVELEALRSDGIPSRASSAAVVPLPGCTRWMAGGEHTVFLAPVYDGDHIRATRVITNVEEKHGRSGTFVLITSTIRYTRANDLALVAEATLTTIARP